MLIRNIGAGYAEGQSGCDELRYWVVAPNWLTKKEMEQLRNKIDEALKVGDRPAVTDWCY